MKKILIITSLYPNKENSVRGIFVKKQVEELVKRYEVKVFATEISKISSYEKYIENDIEIHQTKYKFPKFVISPVYYYFAVKKNLKNLIKNYQPDIIHIHDYKHIPELFVLPMIIDFNKNNVVLTIHNNKQIAENYLFKNGFYTTTLKFSLKKYSKIIVVSKKVKNLISKYCEQSKITIIGNGVNTDFPKIDKEHFNELLPQNKISYQIISVGNLVKTKGFDLLIQVIAKLNKSNFDINLSIIGDGIEKRNLQKLILENKSENKIRLLGRVEHDIVMNLYPYYDAFVLPSWSETFGIVYLEAMLAKIPVIGVKGEGIDGVIIDGENGFLVERNSSIALENKIINLIESKNIDEIIRTAYKDVIANYLLKNVVKKIEGIYGK